MRELSQEAFTAERDAIEAGAWDDVGGPEVEVRVRLHADAAQHFEARRDRMDWWGLVTARLMVFLSVPATILTAKMNEAPHRALVIVTLSMDAGLVLMFLLHQWASVAERRSQTQMRRHRALATRLSLHPRKSTDRPAPYGIQPASGSSAGVAYDLPTAPTAVPLQGAGTVRSTGDGFVGTDRETNARGRSR